MDRVAGKTFYIETFGCQMNVHDSEKVIGTLFQQGYSQVDKPEDAGLVLYNTCSIRDKAEQKVFNRLQNFKREAGHGKIFVYEKGRKTFLLDLNEEFIYVEGSNLLALEDTLTYRVEPIYDAAYQRKIDTVKIFGKGSLAISTSIEPLTLRVTREYPLSISSSSLVAWTGNLIPTVMDDKSVDNVMIEAVDDTGFKIRFEGDGVVVSEQ